MSTTGSGSDSSSSAASTGAGSSVDSVLPRVTLEGMTLGGELYLSARSVEMFLMDLHLRARDDGERELLTVAVEEFRKAVRRK